MFVSCWTIVTILNGWAKGLNRISAIVRRSMRNSWTELVRDASSFCLAEGIEVFDLIDLFRALWKLRICSKRQVPQLVIDMEKQEGMVVKHKERIFAK